MKVTLVTINDASDVTKVFGTPERANAWLEGYVQENWPRFFNDECPTAGWVAVEAYFDGEGATLKVEEHDVET